jgi:transcriptional regulator with XRE-family HTH domain
MEEVGSILATIRKSKGLTQYTLAKRMGMKPVQLCKIEKGNTSPTIATIERIAEALDVSLQSLFSSTSSSNEAIESFTQVRETHLALGVRFRATRMQVGESDIDLDILKKITPIEDTMIENERVLGIFRSTLISFSYALQSDIHGARIAARALRSSCAVGTSPFSDLAEMLEYFNIRIHNVNINKDVLSRSYYDTNNHTFTIVLNNSNTPERHVNRIAYELAWMVMFASSGYKPLRRTSYRHNFAREFAAEFLMPEESVRFAVLQLGIRPNDWSLKMICTLKARFNVSAEAFALRLEALGLIEKYLRQRIRDELHEHYKTHPKAMEPAPRLKSLKIGSRASILNMEVEKRGLKK